MFHEIKQWMNQNKANQISEVLKKVGYTVYQVNDIYEAKAKLLELIPEGASITLGGSVTLDEMGLLELFRSSKYKLFDRYQPMPYPERVELMRQGLLADYMVSGCNAITKRGELVNRDSSGNRVAGMIFGPSNVIMVAGVNKIVNNIDEAFARIKAIAPMNVRRLKHSDAGCTETGFCCDCDLKGRICNYTTIIHNARKHPGRLTMIIIADEIGF